MSYWLPSSCYRYLMDFVEENESRFATCLADTKRAYVLTCGRRRRHYCSGNRTNVRAFVCS